MAALFISGNTDAQTPQTNPPAAQNGVVNNPVTQSPLFSGKEREAIVGYWQAAGRYTIAAPPNALTDGPFQVRLTAEGSAWFLNYQKAVGAGGKFIPPTRDARPTSGPFAEWDAWVSKKVAYDRAMAQQAAENANRLILNKTLVPPDIPAVAAPGTTTPITSAQILLGATTAGLPSAPGAIPAALLAAAGNPPPFAGVVCPLSYTVSFDKPDEIFAYTDNVKLRERYAYYRFPRGVVSYGKQLKDMTPAERDPLFRAAGFSEADQRIFSAVSKLEGGFETVQTYDTGYVSIGFIQFVTLGDGKADLSNVLREMKISDPKAFQEDFRRFGMDVAPDSSIAVLDPATGAELVGNAAVLKIIDDKRLTAVFQRAGRKDAFRVAQIKIARSYYWPQFDPLTITLPDGTTFSGTVGDIIKSEAGLATLLDRKINTGNIRSLPGVAAQCLAGRDCKTIADAALYEKEIVAAMKYRTDFLADATLAQPADPPAHALSFLTAFLPQGPPSLAAPGQSSAPGMKGAPPVAVIPGSAPSAPNLFAAPAPPPPKAAVAPPGPVKGKDDKGKDDKSKKQKGNKKADDKKPAEKSPPTPTPTPASPAPATDPPTANPSATPQ